MHNLLTKLFEEIDVESLTYLISIIRLIIERGNEENINFENDFIKFNICSLLDEF